MLNMIISPVVYYIYDLGKTEQKLLIITNAN